VKNIDKLSKQEIIELFTTQDCDSCPAYAWCNLTRIGILIPWHCVNIKTEWLEHEAEKIDLMLFAAWLGEYGWSQFKKKKDNIICFQKEQPFVQIDIPLDKGRIAYSEALDIAVSTVAQKEHLTESELINAVNNLGK